MQGLIAIVDWALLLHRARRSPAMFLERAGCHLQAEHTGEAAFAASLLFTASHYVADGREMPQWLWI
jgi:hypothetical protein